MIATVCLVARECDGFAGAGGLKDVVRGLADSLVERGVSVTVVVPRYGFMPPGEPLYELDLAEAGVARRVSVTAAVHDGFNVRLIDAHEFASKDDIYTYTGVDAPRPELIGEGHLDVHMMNVLLQAGAVALLHKEGIAPDIIHGHDGHCGLLPLYMRRGTKLTRFFSRTACLVTIHNAGAAYQQSLVSPKEASLLSGLDENLLGMGIVDGRVNPLMIAGGFGSVNTVSPDYSRELLSGIDEYSGSLGTEYRRRGIPLPGIYNGIATKEWLRRSGGSSDKAALRKHLAGILGKGRFEGILVYGHRPNPDRPWLLFHGRLTQQKGLDEILELPVGFMDSCRGHILVYGQGDPEIERDLKLRSKSEASWTFLRGYDEELTAVLLASASFVLVPSKWEPCGQIDMIGQLLGALPIARRVGGLRKIRNGVDGMTYEADDSKGLEKSIRKALNWELNRKRRVSRMRRCAENIIYGRRTWRTVLVRGYLPLYEKARKHLIHE